MFKPSLIVASVAACASFSVYADTVLPTTIVTASRTSQAVNETLASVHVISQEQLAQHLPRFRRNIASSPIKPLSCAPVGLK